jgi:hypothetical protein
VVELPVQILQEAVQVAGVTNHDADLVLDVDRFGKGAQVEADDGLFDPFAGGGDDFFVVHGAGRPAEFPSRGRHFALIMAGLH